MNVNFSNFAVLAHFLRERLACFLYVLFIRKSNFLCAGFHLAPGTPFCGILSASLFSADMTFLFTVVETNQMSIPDKISIGSAIYLQNFRL